MMPELRPFDQPLLISEGKKMPSTLRIHLINIYVVDVSHYPIDFS